MNRMPSPATQLLATDPQLGSPAGLKPIQPMHGEDAALANGQKMLISGGWNDVGTMLKNGGQ